MHIFVKNDTNMLKLHPNFDVKSHRDCFSLSNV